jgi:hypothetical protein
MNDGQIRTLRELTLTEDGDLLISPTGDLAVSLNAQALAEHIMVRLRTYQDEAPAMPGVGARIEDFAGKPNTRETGEALEKIAMDALTRDGFLTPEEVTVTAVPEGPRHIRLYIDPDPNQTGRYQGVWSFDIDLITGELQ